MKKIIVFDLDKTLAKSKSNLESEMSEELKNLISKYLVGIISGGNFEQFEKQILNYLKLDENEMLKLHLFPTCGTQYYKFSDGSWLRVYIEGMSSEEVDKIILALEKLVEEELSTLPSWGPRIENRSNSQITLSVLGQAAPLEEKLSWDPDRTKRRYLRQKLIKVLPEFDIKIGGTTSLDITKPGIDKSYGINKLMEYLGIEKDEILYVGDELEEDGNDYPVKAMGVECIQTSGPDETIEIIKELIK